MASIWHTAGSTPVFGIAERIQHGLILAIADYDRLSRLCTQSGRPAEALLLLYGGRVSFEVAVVAVAVGGGVGSLVGMPSGYFGGKVDLVVMRVVDIVQAFPSILLALALVAALGPNLLNAILAVGFASVPTYARLARGSVLSTKTLTYVEAARVVGAGPVRVMLRHVLPNIMPPLLVLATTGAGLAVSTAAALGFLGLGAQPPQPEWGAMLNEGRNFVRLAWWLGTFPGLAIMLLVLAANLLGDGLRDALDSRLSLRQAAPKVRDRN